MQSKGPEKKSNAAVFKQFAHAINPNVYGIHTMMHVIYALKKEYKRNKRRLEQPQQYVTSSLFKLLPAMQIVKTMRGRKSKITPAHTNGRRAMMLAIQWMISSAKTRNLDLRLQNKLEMMC